MRYIYGLLALICFLPAHAEPAKQCKDFPTQAAAQKYHDQRKTEGKTGWKSLDRDGDGRACDCNAGGSGKNCPNKK